MKVRPKRPAWDWQERDYCGRRLALLIELRVIRRTQPAQRVVKHLQRQLLKLRTYRRMMEDAGV